MPLKKDLGNALWLILHSTALIAHNQPDLSVREQYIGYYKKMEENLIHLLPCPQCQGHYQEHIAQEAYKKQPEPQHLNQLNWLHNQVNILLHKENPPKTFTLEESIKYISDLNEQQQELLKHQFFKTTMTIAKYWNAIFWNRPKKRFKHNIDNMKNFLIFAMKLLSLAEIEETQTYWETTENSYQSAQIYKYLELHGMNKIPQDFSYDYEGCGCLNK